MTESDKVINRNFIATGTAIKALVKALSDSQKEIYNEEIDIRLKKVNFDSELKEMIQKFKV